MNDCDCTTEKRMARFDELLDHHISMTRTEFARCIGWRPNPDPRAADPDAIPKFGLLYSLGLSPRWLLFAEGPVFTEPVTPEEFTRRIRVIGRPDHTREEIFPSCEPSQIERVK